MKDYRPPSLSESLLKKSEVSHLTNFNSIELRYSNLTVTAKVKTTEKTIIYNQSGVLSPGTFTAILGPSGSGKTTLLNFLSGRLVSNNLTIEGGYELNGKAISSVEPYANQIAYIMQDDIIMETMTPRESFMFSANMRLRMSEGERKRRVDALIDQLGLMDCCDTKIGNNLKKGISGGERKRTSIGIELITDPSVIFLDEPTTGLDSTTALQVVLLLRQLANEGRTIVSTIHQPSSEVFYEFDQLLLICEGHCIYKGDSKESEGHFKSIGYECPPLMNLAEYYMDLMSLQLDSREGITDEVYETAKEEHQKKILALEQAYKNSSKYREEMLSKADLPPLEKNNKDFNVSGWKQFGLLFKRALLNQLRNPMDTTMKITQAIFTALVVFAVFGRVNTTHEMEDSSSQDIKGSILQNVRGIIFFLVSFTTFAGLQGTLATFSGQKPMFLRERFSNTYTTWSYFWARSLANFPFELIYPTVPAIIVFYGVGLNNNSDDNFPILLLIVNTLYFCAASYGLFYSAVIPKLEIAMALVPVLIIPFMMLSGFFRDLDQVSKIFYPLEFLSPFRYGYQACMLNEFNGKPYKQKLEDLYIPDTLAVNLYVLLGIGLLLRIFAFIMMYFISNPKRPKIIEPTHADNKALAEQAEQTTQ